MGLKIVNVSSYFPKNYRTINDLKKKDGWDKKKNLQNNWYK